uniref:HTH CENPB-type domain-containing protein n=1 Tax=Maylandia zebra TaxID=106582 RepID=A0A3P9B687_9CICH
MVAQFRCEAQQKASSSSSEQQAAKPGERKVLSMKTKREIIDKYERGGKLSAIAREYGRNPSTIGTILKQKEVIKAGKPSKGTTIMSKRRTPIHDEIKAAPLTSPEFRASHGWFYRFKKRTGNHSVVRHGEAASSDHTAAEEFKATSPSRYSTVTRLASSGKRCRGVRTSPTVSTLALCANASGTIRNTKTLKERLEVMWRSNPKAWVTRQFFVEWVNLVFGPAVKKFLEENELPMKCLLIIDNAPAHPSGLEDDILEEFSFIKVLFLPPNTTPLLQPMDQQVTSNLKRPLREFWKYHFDIVACLKLISLAWREVSRRMLNSAWRKLWPDAVAARDFEGFEGEPQPEVKVEEILQEFCKDATSCTKLCSRLQSRGFIITDTPQTFPTQRSDELVATLAHTYCRTHTHFEHCLTVTFATALIRRKSSPWPKGTSSISTKSLQAVIASPALP